MVLLGKALLSWPHLIWAGSAVTTLSSLQFGWGVIFFASRWECWCELFSVAQSIGFSLRAASWVVPCASCSLLRPSGKMVLRAREYSLNTARAVWIYVCWANDWPVLIKNWILWNGDLVSDEGHAPHSVMCVIILGKELKTACIFQMQEAAGKFLNDSKPEFDFFCVVFFFEHRNGDFLYDKCQCLCMCQSSIKGFYKHWCAMSIVNGIITSV